MALERREFRAHARTVAVGRFEPIPVASDSAREVVGGITDPGHASQTTLGIIGRTDGASIGAPSGGHRAGGRNVHSAAAGQ